MSFTTTPLPKMSRNLTNMNQLSNAKPVTLENNISKNSINDQSHKNNCQKITQTSDNNRAKSKEKFHPKGNILHVTNICPKMLYEQIKKGLYNLFSVHGPIYEIIIKTKDNGQHYAFIDFPDINHAESAWKAARNQGKRLQNKLLMINYCQDPKKNIDRKDQKCFLCHGTGHKAIKCPIKPQMIKPKAKKLDESWGQEDQTNYVEQPNISPKNIKQVQAVLQQQQNQQSQPKQQRQSQEQQSQEVQRDRDYLRFLKLKKKLLQKKLNKKLKKSRKKKN